MILFGGLLVSGAILIWLSIRDDDNPFFFFPGGFLALAGLLFILLMVVNRIGVGNELAQIASLREITATVDTKASEDILGQVAQTNQLIASNKWYRGQWWSKDFVAAEWDTVSKIAIRQEVSSGR